MKQKCKTSGERADAHASVSRASGERRTREDTREEILATRFAEAHGALERAPCERWRRREARASGHR